MRAVWLRYSRMLKRHAPALAWDVAALLAALAWWVYPVLGAGAVVAVALGLWWTIRRRIDEYHEAARGLLIAAAGIAWVGTAAAGALGILAVAALWVAVLGDRIVRELVPGLVGARRLPGVPQLLGSGVGPFLLPTTVGTVLLAVGASARLSAWLVAAPVAALVAAGSAVTGREILAGRRRADVNALARAVAAYDPAFAVYFAGKPEAAYQVQMWLPFLARANRRFVLVVREPAHLDAMAAVTDVPVVAASRVETLEGILPAGVAALFYVNNDALNVDGVRMPGPTHVHLGHGDSEKPSSYSPTIAMYDRVFVAGQAAVDRFARHGVSIPSDKFVLVGRPQLETVEGPDSRRAGRPVVLYAPTWRGGLADMNLGSLEWGAELVRAVRDAGAAVIFRPHPFSARDAESRVHIQAIDDLLTEAGDLHSADARRLPLVECFNRSDALVTDVSSVASDYLASGKPLAVTLPGGAPPGEYPFLAGCYLMRRGDELGLQVAAMLGPDPLVGERVRLRRYYLGEGANAAESFVAAVRTVIETPGPRRTSRAGG